MYFKILIKLTNTIVSNHNVIWFTYMGGTSIYSAFEKKLSLPDRSAEVM